jgi:hypothetical protein
MFFVQRRLSEPSGGMPISSRSQRPNTSHQMNGTSNISRSENEGLDKCNNTWNEIEAGDVRDGKWKLRIQFSHYSVVTFQYLYFAVFSFFFLNPAYVLTKFYEYFC